MDIIHGHGVLCMPRGRWIKRWLSAKNDGYHCVTVCSLYSLLSCVCVLFCSSSSSTSLDNCQNTHKTRGTKMDVVRLCNNNNNKMDISWCFLFISNTTNLICLVLLNNLSNSKFHIRVCLLCASHAYGPAKNNVIIAIYCFSLGPYIP